MKLFTAAILLFSTLLVSSCGILRNPDFSLVSLGMTKEEVISQLGKPQRVVGAQRYDDGILEIYEYKIDKLVSDEIDSRYNWLYFLNNELQEFGDRNQYIPNEYDRYYNKYRKSRR